LINTSIKEKNKEVGEKTTNLERLIENLNELFAIMDVKAYGIEKLLCCMMNQPGRKWTFRSLANVTGLNEKMVYDLISKLEMLGFVVKLGHPKIIMLRDIFEALINFKASSKESLKIEKQKMIQQFMEKIDRLTNEITAFVSPRSTGVISQSKVQIAREFDSNWTIFFLNFQEEILWMNSQMLLPPFYVHLFKLLSILDYKVDDFIGDLLRTSKEIKILISRKTLYNYLNYLQDKGISQFNEFPEMLKLIRNVGEKMRVYVLKDDAGIHNFQIIDRKKILFPIFKPKPFTPELQEFKIESNPKIIRQYMDLFFDLLKKSEPIKEYLKRDLDLKKSEDELRFLRSLME